MVRPGAVCNVTLAEYKRFVITKQGVTVIKVKDHKTGNYGTAKLTLDPPLAATLARYVETIRPLAVDKGEDPGTLFVLPGSKPIGKWSNLESFLRGQINAEIPTSTKARKIGTTVAIRQLDGTSNNLITTQMSHQAGVAEKHYACVAGPEDAGRAFTALESLRVGSPSPTSAATTYKAWPPEDSDQVYDIFSKYIVKDVSVSLQQCKKVLHLFPTRTPKNIQDKVKTLRDQYKRNTKS